jgi:Protein of unknown function (DUF4235)
MADAAGKIVFRILTIAISIPVTRAVAKIIERAWLAAHPDDPPRTPTEAEVRWADALAWAALSAAGIVVAKLITRRGAESAYRVVLGAPPPRAKSKAERKAEKKASKQADKRVAQAA